jgi:hypothetical protein
MPEIKTALESLSKQIDALLNPPATRLMSAEEFTAYAKGQLAKAQSETGASQKTRLVALKSTLASVGEIFAKGAETVDVPSFTEPVPVPSPAAAPTEVAPTPEPAAEVPADDVTKGGHVFWPHDLADEVKRQKAAGK